MGKNKKRGVTLQTQKTIENSNALEPKVIGKFFHGDKPFNMIQNGFQDVLFQGGGQGRGGVQLSQTDTLFKNNRWYLISNNRQLLNQIYVEHGLIQTIVDVPVDDALRGGLSIKSQQLGEKDVRKVEIALDRKDIYNSTAGQAMKWNRLFGGAGIIIVTDQDPMTPLDIDAIGKDTPLEFIAADMWELFWSQQNVEGFDPAGLIQAMNEEDETFQYYSYYNTKLHKSRVIMLKGVTAPSLIRPQLRGWGVSIIETLIRSINQYLKNNDLTFEVLDEFKVDIFKINNLTESLMSEEGELALKKRVAMANMEKNYQNAITMDKEDDYDHKQLSFAGLADIMKEIRMQIASDMRMPLTKIFGISAAGFNSGEDDIEVYNAMVESQIRAKVKYPLLRIIEIMCQQQFGFIPDDLEIEFQPLRMLSAEQEENIKTQKFARALQAEQSGQIDRATFLKICNKDDLLGIQVDVTTVELNLDGQQDDSADEEDGDDAPDAKDDSDGGANKPNTQKSKAPAAPKSTLTPKKTPEAKD